ncbi:hypothetical protein H0E87_027256 [Populus deltoides]|uniref:Uncharacterized protein n=1 Tax=Populus deltoides TaxID=3696 RepID=A0A8T2WWN3_POPDE|nr:hypothetical protein H0E87_027256 [Populus deltoides]
MRGKRLETANSRTGDSKGRDERNEKYQAHDGPPVCSTEWRIGLDLYDKVAEVSNEATQYYAEGSTEDFDDKQFNELCVASYICFIDSLIDHPEDVREMRSQGKLLNTLGSDQQVTELFNEIANYSVPN